MTKVYVVEEENVLKMRMVWALAFVRVDSKENTVRFI